MRPRALDLFCGAGGAAMGLHRAGFDVTGIDIKPQPRYPFAFVQADALNPPVKLDDFDFVWASPPCQAFTTLTLASGIADRHPDHINATREIVARAPLYCIENVPGAPLRTTIVLTGEMFGLDTYRRRHFETNFLALAPPPGKPFGPISRPGAETICGHPGGHSRRSTRDGQYRKRGNLARWREVMGIDWMRGMELTQAVPPAYSEFIGRAALHHPNGRAIMEADGRAA